MSAKDGFLLVAHVPYVTATKSVKLGTLVAKLCLDGERTIKPDDHIAYFVGEYPCRSDGSAIGPLKHNSTDQSLAGGLTINHSFSNKPAVGYADYYEKMTNYVSIISHEAIAIDPSATAKTFREPESDEQSVFQYTDTNTSRAGIGLVSEKLKATSVGIIGLGGTGSYVLDLVAKTRVREIHLFDRDRFVQHNAFRAPGAPSLDQLGSAPFKTDYFRDIYSRMHRHVHSHAEYVAEDNVHALPQLDFFFVCVDKGPIKRALFAELERRNVPFIDVGMGVHAVDDKLLGILRVTLSTPSNRDSAKTRVSFEDGGDDEYKSNIQIADLNMLNASLAVIRWKKLFGVYQDFEKELHSTYTMNVNMLLSEDREP